MPEALYETSSNGTGYDIIGDVHGCYDALVALLEKLGYQKLDGVYHHLERQAIFLGDLVDRGPKIRETLYLVKNMVEQGSAHMVLGNHELNAICYSTPAPDGCGKSFLREHTERHQKQIAETLTQLNQSEQELEEFVRWFLTLPLMLEFDHFRVVHACWDHDMIDSYKNQHGSLHLQVSHLHHEFFECNVRRTVDRLTRGTDMRLPGGEAITGSDGYTRYFFRTKFWVKEPKTYGDIVFQPDALPEHIHNMALSEQDHARLIHYGEEERPLFIGHYWLSDQPNFVQHNIACLDFSAVNGGRLVAYRMDQEKTLDASKFVWVNVD